MEPSGRVSIEAALPVVLARTRAVRQATGHTAGAVCALTAAELIGTERLTPVSCAQCATLVLAVTVALVGEVERAGAALTDPIAYISGLAERRLRSELSLQDGTRGFTQKPQRLVRSASVVGLLPDPVEREIFGEMLVFCRREWPARPPYGWPLEAWLGSIDPILGGPSNVEELRVLVERILEVLESPSGRRAFRDPRFLENNIERPFSNKLAQMHQPILEHLAASPDDLEPVVVRTDPVSATIVGAVEAARTELGSQSGAVRRQTVHRCLLRQIKHAGAVIDLDVLEASPRWEETVEQLYRERRDASAA